MAYGFGGQISSDSLLTYYDYGNPDYIQNNSSAKNIVASNQTSSFGTAVYDNMFRGGVETTGFSGEYIQAFSRYSFIQEDFGNVNYTIEILFTPQTVTTYGDNTSVTEINYVFDSGNFFIGYISLFPSSDPDYAAKLCVATYTEDINDPGGLFPQTSAAGPGVINGYTTLVTLVHNVTTNNTKFYVNGELVYNGTYAIDILYDDLRLGNNFNCKFHNIKLYTKELSASEVYKNYLFNKERISVL